MSDGTWREVVATVRPDVIEELCFADHFRRPLTRDHYDRLRSFMPPEEYQKLSGFRDINETRARFRSPDRVAFTYIQDCYAGGRGGVLISEGPFLRRIVKTYEGLLEMIFDQVIESNGWQGSEVHRGLFRAKVVRSGRRCATYSLGYEGETGNCHLLEAHEIAWFVEESKFPPTPAVGFAYYANGHLEMLDPDLNQNPWEGVIAEDQT